MTHDLAAITSNVGRLLVGDDKVKAWRESGLLSPSIVTGIIRTIKHDMIAGKMGELPASELHSVKDKLREIWRSDLVTGRRVQRHRLRH